MSYAGNAQLTSINRYLDAMFPGVMPGHNHRIETLFNAMFPVAAIYDITITAADNTTYTLSVAGLTFQVLSDGTATTQEIRDAFVAQLNADVRINQLVLATPQAAAVLRITERRPIGGAVAVSEADANLALATTTAHGDETGIPAGVIVVGGTAPSGFYMEGTPARLPTTGDAAAAFLGGVGFSEYAAWDQRLPRGPGNVGMYPSGKTMPVVREGYIALISEVASPAQGAAIYARRVAAGGNTQLGAVTTVADGTNTIQLTNGYRFTGRNGTSGGLYVAEVEINIPT